MVLANFKQKYQTWLNRRLPRAKSIQLNQRRIFIFPNTMGLLFLIMIALLFVTGVNYQNNLMLSICFFMVSLFITTIVATYQNLSALIVKTSACDSVFSGETVLLPITLENPTRKNKIGLSFSFEGGDVHTVSIVEQSQLLKLPFKTRFRGYLTVPRIKLKSVYPLGLINCWTWLRLDFEGIVYPSVVEMPFRMAVGEQDDTEDGQVLQAGMEEFEGLKTYQKGDSLKRVAWKQYAKTQQLMTKQYSEHKGDDQCFDWFALPGFQMEERLQILCGWVVKAHRQNSDFSLKLPNEFIALGSGEQHLHICLRALALFGSKVVSNV